MILAPALLGLVAALAVRGRGALELGAAHAGHGEGHGALEVNATESPDVVLVPFVEVMDQCLYAPREVPECVDFERHGPSLNHAITRRYVFMVVVLAIAVWSLANGMCLEAIGRIMNIEKDEENREVLNAVV